MLIYECEGTEQEIKEWFKTINIAGVPLNNQELLNAVYSGPFVTAAKEVFSNSQTSQIQKWSAYINGAVNRQDFLETALEWVSRGKTEEYMRDHRFSSDITELVNYFNSVIAWVRAVFPLVENEMRGLPWGELYERYHATPYNPTQMAQRVKELYADPYVKNRRGVFEYLLGVKQRGNILTSVYLMRQPSVPFMPGRPRRQRKRNFKLPRLRHRPSSYRAENMEAK